MRKHNRLFIMALSLVLCMSVSIGLAVAYFTDYENARGGAILKLDGQTELHEEPSDTQKIITIKNVDKTDMVVRVMVIADESHLGVIEGNDWFGPDDDGWYYYKKVLKGSPDGEHGDETSRLVAKVTADADENINDFEIVVVHEAERAVYEQKTVEGKIVNVVSAPEGWDIAADTIKAE